MQKKSLRIERASQTSLFQFEQFTSGTDEFRSFIAGEEPGLPWKHMDFDEGAE